jgi:hypothetical protein
MGTPKSSQLSVYVFQMPFASMRQAREMDKNFTNDEET